jgi:uncharacterized membrane protein
LAATGGEGDLGAIDVTKTITINAPREEVYGLWSNYENFAQFMNNIEAVHDLGGGRSHWIVKGPVGSKVEFDAITTEKIPNEVVAWETTPDSTVRHSGRVRFKETRPGRTQVNVNMTYTPPAGVAGHAVAVLFGKDPKSEMDEDLRRMKNLLERGATLSEGKTVTRDQVMPVTGGTAQNMDALGTVDAANEDMGAREEDMNVSPMDEIGVSVRGEDADPVEDDSMSVPYQGSIKGELDRGEDTNHEDDLGHSPMQGFEENNTGE